MAETRQLVLRTQTLGSFVDALASATPVPGGGSASAAAAALGAGLVAMVAGLSHDRPAYEAFAATHAASASAARDLGPILLSLADADADAYAAFAAALRMPRATDEERDVRTAAIRAAARTASDVPLRTLEACRDLVEAAEALAGRSNRNASSDLAVATRLAEAAAHGAAANVRVNLGSIGDPEAVDVMEARVAELLADVEERAETARAFIEMGELRDPEPASGG